MAKQQKPKSMKLVLDLDYEQMDALERALAQYKYSLQKDVEWAAGCGYQRAERVSKVHLKAIRAIEKRVPIWRSKLQKPTENK